MSTGEDLCLGIANLAAETTRLVAEIEIGNAEILRLREELADAELKRSWWNRRRLAKDRVWECESGDNCKGDCFTGRTPPYLGAMVWCSMCKP